MSRPGNALGCDGNGNCTFQPTPRGQAEHPKEGDRLSIILTLHIFVVGKLQLFLLQPGQSHTTRSLHSNISQLQTGKCVLIQLKTLFISHNDTARYCKACKVILKSDPCLSSLRLRCEEQKCEFTAWADTTKVVTPLTDSVEPCWARLFLTIV